MIGAGLLMHFLSTIDYCGGKLVLAPRSSAGEFEKRAAAVGANSVPFWLVGDHFMFARRKLNQADGLFLIDTGLAGAGLTATKAMLDAAGVTVDESNTLTGEGGGGTVQFVPFRAAATLGNLTRSDLPGVYMASGNPLARFPFGSSESPCAASAVKRPFYDPTSVKIFRTRSVSLPSPSRCPSCP